jgi:hypothetical protein
MGLVIGGSLQFGPRRPGNKKPRSRTGQGSFQNTRPFSGLFNVAASRSAQITTIAVS